MSGLPRVALTACCAIWTLGVASRLCSAVGIQLRESTFEVLIYTFGGKRADVHLYNHLKVALSQCTNGGKPGAHCKFHDLLVYDGVLFFVHTGPISLPDLRLYHMARKGDDDHLRDYLFHLDPTYLPPWVRANVTVEEEYLPEALIWFWANIGNMYHQLTENGQMMHNAMCELLDRCKAPTKADDDDSFQIISLKEFQYDERDSNGARPPYDDIFKCFTTQPVVDLSNSAWKGKVVRLGVAALGLGMDCKADDICDPAIIGTSTYTKALLERYITPSRAESYRKRMMRCYGVNPARTANPRKPRVTLVNRGYSVRRSFLNIQDVLPNLQSVTGLRVRVQYLEGKTLKQNAELFAATDILFVAHGASLGIMIFLPINAVIVEVVPYGCEWVYNGAYSWIAEEVYGPSTHYRHLRYVTGSHEVVFRREAVLADDKYEAMSVEDKAWFWEAGVCPPHLPEVEAWCSNKWALRGADWLLDAEEVATRLTEAHSMLLEDTHHRGSLVTTARLAGRRLREASRQTAAWSG